MASGQERGASIWWLAFGYFASYVPYSALTKLVSSGAYPGIDHGVPGLQLVPITAIASLAGMALFLTLGGYWPAAGRRRILGLSLPCPGPWTFFSGLCTAAIIITTTLAYTIDGVSIVFMMLLMRGGVLAIGPVVDALSRRHVRWFSWVALGLSLCALLVALDPRGPTQIGVVATVDVIVYLVGYFVRLRTMSRLAKSTDRGARARYFVEEQMVATPALVLALGVVAFLLPGEAGAQVRLGFTEPWTAPWLLPAIVIGLCSQGTGVFGGLILLDPRENTFCIPVNRASSVLAGLGASAVLVWVAAKPWPGSRELLGAGLVIAAIAVLALPELFLKPKAKPAPAPDPVPPPVQLQP